MKDNGFCIYDGPSLIDGEPIVALVTGFKVASKNGKTGGDLLQTWILHANVDPLQAQLTGADEAVCGDCPHRGRLEGGGNPGRSCYVNVGAGVRNLWLAFKRGNYPYRLQRDVVAHLAEGVGVRLGAYGDPAAVPTGVWEDLVSRAAFWTGYTRRWRDCSDDLRRLCMASVESETERLEAKALGWRTFRVRAPWQAVGAYEVVCPASAEAGHKLQCGDCRACSGLGGRARADIAIIAHGGNNRVASFERRAAASEQEPAAGRLPFEAGRRGRSALRVG